MFDKNIQHINKEAKRMLRMDEINKIRKSFYTHGENKHQIAKKFSRAWETVHRAIDMKRDELENRGKRQSRVKPVMTPEVITAIEKYFEEEIQKAVKKKQRYSARTIYEELKEKQIYHGSLRRMQEVVSLLRDTHSQTKKSSFLPLEFPIGSALQIDHGEVDLEIGGIRVKGYLFVASVPGQVLRYCQVMPTKASEAWGEFHERAFRFFEGVFPRIIYDNDSVLVKEIVGNQRKQTNFSLSLEEHYGFESHFCNLASGNEKGAVENAVGYCRRRFLTGCPSFQSWESANELLNSCSTKDIKNGKHYKTQENLSALLIQTQEQLNSLPPKKKWCRWIKSRVNKCQLVTIDSHQYSVPEKFVGSHIRAAITATEIELFKDEEQIALHQRQYGKEDSLKLDHYLDQLLYKPAAFSYAKAVSQHSFHPTLLEIWNRLSEKHGKREGNKQFTSILLLRRTCSQEELLKGVEQALNYGAIEYAAIELMIRQTEVSSLHIDEEEIHQFIPGPAPKWKFDLAPYAELCEEVVS